MYQWEYDSPLGKILLTAEEEGLTGLWFFGQKYFARGITDLSGEKRPELFEESIRWLDLYFQGEKPCFLPGLHLSGTEFQMLVWEALLRIPYGEQKTYKQIAAEIAAQRGLERMSCQAVGQAVGHNKISLIVPCHRVVGADGSLTGYAGGTEKKQWLLDMERRWKKTTK